MNNLEKKLKFLASKIRLSDREKENVKAEILRSVFARSSMYAEKVRSPFFSMFRFAPTVLILILFVGGGVSFAARGTLPGDILYPFKLGVTEKVQGLFLVSKKEQAKFEIILIERRAEEAIKLVKTGKLDEKKSATLNMAFEKHAEAVNTKIEELKETDKEAAKEVVSNLSTSLTEQVENISKIQNTTEKDSFLPLTANMQEKAKNASDKKNEITTQILLDPKWPTLTEELEEKIDEVIDIDFSDESMIDDFEDKSVYLPKKIETSKDIIKGVSVEKSELQTQTEKK